MKRVVNGCLQRMKGQFGKVFDRIAQALPANLGGAWDASAKVDRLLSLHRSGSHPLWLPSYFQRGSAWSTGQTRLCVSGSRGPGCPAPRTPRLSGFLGKKQGNQEEATWMSPNYPEPHSMASKVAALKLSSLKYVIPRTCPLPGNLSQGAVWGPSGCSLWPSLLQRMWGSHWEVGRGACVVFPPWSTTNE